MLPSTDVGQRDIVRDASLLNDPSHVVSQGLDTMRLDLIPDIREPAEFINLI